MSPSLTRRARGAVLAAVVLTGGALAVPSASATAGTLPAGTSSQWQTDGDVWALATKGGILYAGGSFSNLLPPAGTSGSSIASAGIAAFSTSSGAPVAGWHHSMGKVNALAVSPDGTTLYAGGDFTKVDGQTRNHAAAFDLTQSGAPLKTWNPNVGGGSVRAIAVTSNSSGVILGGDFTTVGGAGRPNLAQVSSSGAVSTWAPRVDGPVDAALMAPGGSRVVIGGNFNNVNGQAHRAVASVDAVNGTINGPTDALIAPCSGTPCAGVRSDVKALVTDGTNIYLGAEGTGGGIFDGTIAFNASTGHQVWKDNCLGATQALAVISGKLYVGSHAHDCSAINGFGQLPNQNGPLSWHQLMAEGASNGGLLDWFPTTNAGALDSSGNLPPNTLGPRAMATDGTNLFLGGQFTTVNGTTQRGLARFMTTSPEASPVQVTNAVMEKLPNGTVVGRFSAGSGGGINVPGQSDKDSNTFSYAVYRDGAGSPVATFSNVSVRFWRGPFLTFRDTGGASAHSYTIRMTDEGGRSSTSDAFPVTSGNGSYGDAVAANGPAKYWRFDETSGTTAGDSTLRGSTGRYFGSYSLGVTPGAIPTGRAVHLNSTGGVASTFGPGPASNSYTVETWIRTNSRSGGRIWGYGNSQSGTSTSFDRLLYITNNGQLIFGVWNGGPRIAMTNKSYSDGSWHHVAATQDSHGLTLYVDGQLVATNSSATTGANYSGYWRVGYDSLAGWPYSPGNIGFTGEMDEFAIYTNGTTAATTRSHIAAQ